MILDLGPLPVWPATPRNVWGVELDFGNKEAASGGNFANAFAMYTSNDNSTFSESPVIQLAGKTIYINPFLYWRRFDSNTDRWLREPGQLSEEQIQQNRIRFYPELEWALLDERDQEIKDGAVEMFLKSLELICTFHPELTSGQLLEVERKMAITKKRSFERWVEKSYRRRSREVTREKRRFERNRFLRGWGEWIALDTTHQALVPVVALLVLSAVAGWSLGSAQSSCPTLVLPPEQTGVR